MTSKYNIWTAILNAIVKASLLPWNVEIAGPITFPEASNVEIRFISSISRPRLRTKIIIWTLAEAFDIYNTQRHYSNSFLKVQLGTGATAQNLGVGSIKSILAIGQAIQLDSSVSNSSDNLSLEAGSSTPVFEVPQNIITNQSTIPGTDLSLPTNNTNNNHQLGSDALSFSLSYLQNGITINDRLFVRLIVKLLTFGAQHDQEAPCGFISAYSAAENYTFAIGPTSQASKENLPWRLAIPALGYLPSEMLEHGHGGRWAELSGRIKLDGAYIGKVLIVKGDKRYDTPGWSCEVGGVEPPDGGNGDVDNDTSEA